MKTLLLALLFLFACSDADRTVEVLEDQGYTNITTNGHAWLGCAGDDHFCTAFEATGPSGRRVTGVVGCGWGWGFGKSCTLRIRRGR